MGSEACAWDTEDHFECLLRRPPAVVHLNPVSLKGLWRMASQSSSGLPRVDVVDGAVQGDEHESAPVSREVTPAATSVRHGVASSWVCSADLAELDAVACTRAADGPSGGGVTLLTRHESSCSALPAQAQASGALGPGIPARLCMMDFAVLYAVRKSLLLKSCWNAIR